MEIQKEIIDFEPGRSVKVFSPRMRRYFYWHYHPEVELVYVEATNGIRHVGKHISGFVGSDLVLIGSGVPHLNFDYGVETEYRQTVVQFSEAFYTDLLKYMPELAGLRILFDRACKGLSFSGETKRRVAAMLEELKAQSPLASLLGVVRVLEVLAGSSDVEELNAGDTRVRWFLNDKIRMATIYDYIHRHYHANPDVHAIAREVHLSTPAFCRYFKKQTDITFTEFVNRYRINQAKTLLLQQKSISDVSFQVGYQSISYFNKLFKQQVGETPSAFMKRYAKPLPA